MKNYLFFLAIFFSSYLFSQIASSSAITFKYDASGNQIERKYASFKNEPKENVEIEATLANQFEDMLKVYPNPTKGQFSIEWEKEFSQYISNVEVLSADALIHKNPVNLSINKLDIDLTSKQSGIYFVRFHFTDGSIVSKKVIKK